MKKRILKRKIFWGALCGTTLITPVIFLSAVSCVPEIKKFKSNIFIDTNSVNETLFVNQNENLPVLSVKASADNQNVQLTYQWYESDTNSTTSGKPIPGATGATYTLSEVNTQKAGTKYYYAVVSASSGDAIVSSKISEIYTIKVSDQIPPINIKKQPENQTAIVNQTNDLPTFSVSATTNNSNEVLNYQWYSNTTNSSANGTKILGATNPLYKITNSDVLTPQSKYFYVKITGSINGIALNPVISNTVNLTVNALPKIFVQEQPQNADVSLNQTENLPTFSVAVENISNAQLNYQWYSTTNTTGSNNDWQLISGATNSSYTVPASDAKRVGPKHYYVRVNGSINGVSLVGVNSGVATLRVNPLPRIIITNQPQNSDVLVNQTTNLPTLYVNATTGNTNINLNYQWYSNTTNSTNNGTACWSNLSFINHSC